MPAILMLISLISLLMFSTVTQAQTISATIPAYDQPASGIVLLMFGMDHPVRIGEIDASGALTMNVRAASAESIADTMRTQYLGRLYDNLHFKCDDRSAIGSPTENVVARADNIFLHRDGTMSGALFAVSDSMLRPWLEDPGYQEPVVGSFWEVIYAEKELAVSASCTGTLTLESGDVSLAYEYALQLVPGFNLVEYAIERIHKTDPEVMASKPSKVLVRTSTDTSRIQWVAKHSM